MISDPTKGAYPASEWGMERRSEDIAHSVDCALDARFRGVLGDRDIKAWEFIKQSAIVLMEEHGYNLPESLALADAAFKKTVESNPELYCGDGSAQVTPAALPAVGLAGAEACAMNPACVALVAATVVAATNAARSVGKAASALSNLFSGDSADDDQTSETNILEKKGENDLNKKNKRK